MRPARPSLRRRPMDGRLQLGCGVFLLAMAAYLMTANGHLQGPDQEYYYRMAQAVALEHSFAVEELPDVGGGQQGVDGRFYAQYAPGLPVVLAPLVLIGRGLAAAFEPLAAQDEWGDSADWSARFLVSYANAPITAAAAALLAVLVARLGYPPTAATFTAVVFALATLAWGQARTIFAEPLQALLLLAGVLFLVRATATRAVLGGAAIGLAVLVKLTSVLALPALLLLPDASGRGLWRRPGAVLGVLAPTLAALALHALYNLLRFGDALTTAYYSGDGSGGVDFNGDLWVGLYGLLLSPGRGVLWYAPPVLAAVVAFPRFSREHPTVGKAFLGLALVWLLVHARWADWHGGWGWGPRYLLPILPMVLVPLAGAWLSRRARPLLLGLAAVGVVVQVPGATVDFMDWGRQLLDYCSASTCWSTQGDHYLDPAWSDLKGHTQLLLAGHLDVAWLKFGGTWLRPFTIYLALALALYGGCLLLGPMTTRTWPDATSESSSGRQRPGRSTERSTGTGTAGTPAISVDSRTARRPVR